MIITVKGKELTQNNFYCRSHVSYTTREVAKKIVLSKSNPEQKLFTLLCKLIFKKYLSPDSNTLDLGSGWGRHAVSLLDLGHRVVALETSRVMLKCAKLYLQKYYLNKRASFIQGEFAKDKLFSKNEFDAVICLGNVFGCYDYRPLVAEMAAVLKRNGMMICNFRNKEYYEQFLKTKKQYAELAGNDEQIITDFPDKKDQMLFNKGGLLRCKRGCQLGKNCYEKTFSSNEFDGALSEYGFKTVDVLTQDKIYELLKDALSKDKGGEGFKTLSKFEENRGVMPQELFFIARRK